MCGRTACTLAPHTFRKACSYRDKNSGHYREPELKTTSCEYRPSYNLCPTDVSLVIVSGTQLDSKESQVLVPMLWGMIPPWHKGGVKGHGLTTHNCRFEGVTKSKLYGPPLTSGRRCVIVCDGFYEWQTTKGDKNRQPYFIYMKQPEGVSIVDGSKDLWSEETGWSGRRLLYIAGLYNTTHSPEGELQYSYSMFTVESNSFFSWLHERIPAILETEQQVEDWLDVKRVPTNKALSLLKPVSCLSWHKVAPLVNNCRYKEAMCNKPLSESKACNPLMKWLQKSSPSKRPSEATDQMHLDSKQNANNEESESKKIKTELPDVKKEESVTEVKESVEDEDSVNKKVKAETLEVNKEKDLFKSEGSLG